ncbi:MAG: hypothetical protein CSA65_04615 [Proteobacteria bacterium]|nr:MAG: hypothetical protein CSB49_02925 [Pseudomonadota bacterium]PIE18570.1 MAG: hypothetical protein CSA65_04615 [Pseudomonadota bacterium]
MDRQDTSTPRWLALALVAGLLGPAAAAAAGRPARSVLVLHSYHQGLPWVDRINDGVESVLGRQKRRDLHLLFAYLDSKRLQPAAAFALHRGYLKARLAHTRVAAVLVADNNALRFALDYRDELFPHVPIVFCGVNNYTPALLRGSATVTGVVEHADHRATIALMRAVHPTRTHLLIVSDATPTSDAIRAELARCNCDRDLRIETLIGASLDEIEQKLASLGPASMVYLTPLNRDRAGRYVDGEAVMAVVRRAHTVPVYSSWDFYLRGGIVGGVLVSPYRQGRTAAGLLEQILDGRPVAELPVVSPRVDAPTFDYAQLSRFHLSRDELPEGSVVVDAPPSFYLRHRTSILAALALASLAALLLLWRLVVQWRQHRRLQSLHDELALEQERLVQLNTNYLAEQDRRFAAERIRHQLQAAIDQSDQLIAILDHERRVEYANVALMRACSAIKPADDAPTANPRAGTSPLLEALLDEPTWAEVLERGCWQGRRRVACPLEPSSSWEAQIVASAFAGIDERRLVTVTIRDISREVALQAELAHAEQLQAIGSLTSGIAHDVGNVLTPILMLGRELRQVAEDSAREPLDEIIAAAERGRQLARNLMSLGRGGGWREAEPTRAAEPINEARRLLRRSLPEGVSLECELEACDALVRADPLQLHQIVMNLGANAVHAMRDGGGTLRIALTTVTSEERAEAPEGAKEAKDTKPTAERLRLEVADTGCGMTHAVQARIFDPYFTTKPPGEGTGLGLANVHNIVVQLSGSIAIDSEPGVGTTFRVELPVVGRAALSMSGSRPLTQIPEAHPVATQSAAAGSESPAAGSESPAADSESAAVDSESPAADSESAAALRVLLVDDDASVLRALERLLTRDGYRVETAEGGHEALALLEQIPVDLVLSDLTMPELDGVELLTRIRERWPTLPTIIASARHDIAESIDLDVPRIAKPIELSDLRRVISEALL